MSVMELANDFLHSSGKRMTDQRRLVIQLLEKAAGKLDAETLYLRARQEDANISLATVYRTLHFLEEAGLITQRYLSRDHERKIYQIGPVRQYTFTCQACGQQIPFTSPAIDDLRYDLEERLALDINDICLCVNGLCPTCQAATHQSEDKSMEPTTLARLAPGQKATVKKVRGKGAIRRRLMDMGIVNGATIEMVKAAPLGDPIAYKVQGYQLSLRKAEAEQIEIEL